MDRWEGKTALVTGASSGIGSALVEDLVRNGINVVAVARRMQALEALKSKLSSFRGKVFPLGIDLNKESDVILMFNWIDTNLGPLHILINNAAYNNMLDTEDYNHDEWMKHFNVNVFAVAHSISLFRKSVDKHNVQEAQIINVSSIVANRYLNIPKFYIYTATKHALKIITLGLRRELVASNPNIRLCCISPGYVKDTELFDSQMDFKANADGKSGLVSTDISRAVLAILAQPHTVRVDDMIVQGTTSLL